MCRVVPFISFYLYHSKILKKYDEKTEFLSRCDVTEGVLLRVDPTLLCDPTPPDAPSDDGPFQGPLYFNYRGSCFLWDLVGVLHE